MNSVYPEQSQMNYTVNMTETAIFQCVATGISAPSITWFRNGIELSNPRVTLNDPFTPVTVMSNEGEMVLQVTRTLSLSMSEDEDSGSYECRASNDATPGEDRESFELVVQSKSSHRMPAIYLIHIYLQFHPTLL